MYIWNYYNFLLSTKSLLSKPSWFIAWHGFSLRKHPSVLDIASRGNTLNQFSSCPILNYQNKNFPTLFWQQRSTSFLCRYKWQWKFWRSQASAHLRDFLIRSMKGKTLSSSVTSRVGKNFYQTWRRISCAQEGLFLSSVMLSVISTCMHQVSVAQGTRSEGIRCKGTAVMFCFLRASLFHDQWPNPSKPLCFFYQMIWATAHG